MKVLFLIDAGSLSKEAAVVVIGKAIEAFQDHAEEASRDYGLSERDIREIKLPIVIVGTEE
jgi:hypothetical protein